MKVKDCMAAHAVSIACEEPASVAARLMARYNLGMLPVTGPGGKLAGVVTDRDLVLRHNARGAGDEQPCNHHRA